MPRVLIPAFPKMFQRKNFIPLAEVNRWRLLKESVEWPENVDQSHLVLASGRQEEIFSRIKRTKHITFMGKIPLTDVLLSIES